VCYYVEKENVFFFLKMPLWFIHSFQRMVHFVYRLLLSDFFKILKLATILNRQLKK
jgi:hypothetical protein